MFLGIGLPFELVRDKVGHNLDGDRVVTALRDDDVGVAFGRFDVLQVHGFEYPLVAVDYHLDRASPLDDVAVDDPDEAVIGIGIDKYFHVHHVAQLFVAENQDTLDDDDVAGLDGNRLLRPGAGEEREEGLLDVTE